MPTRAATGAPAPYDPAMTVKLLLYAYCLGIPSSRKIDRATYRDVAFSILAADQHPDHHSLADVRKRHREALAGLFVQALQLCRTAGLLALGHFPLDGTNVKANVSTGKAMSYGRMTEAEQRLERNVWALLEAAQQADGTEDAETTDADHRRASRGGGTRRKVSRRNAPERRQTGAHE